MRKRPPSIRQAKVAPVTLEPKRKTTLARRVPVRTTLPGRCRKKVRGAGFGGGGCCVVPVGGLVVVVIGGTTGGVSLPQSPGAAAPWGHRAWAVRIPGPSRRFG